MWLLSLALRHWKPLALVAVIAALIAAGYGWKAHNARQAAELADAQNKIRALTLAVKQAEATERVVTKYVDRVKVVAGRTRVIIKEIPVYVPADTPDLPAGFRVVHDSAAQGVIPDPARIADAAPVPVQDAAETIVTNYGTCHETAEQVIALQDWIRAQQAVGAAK